MVYIIIFLAIVLVITYCLYVIGKKVKAQEVDIKKQITDNQKKNKKTFFKDYSKHHYSKTPTIKR